MEVIILPRVQKITDEQLIEEFVTNDLSSTQIAKKYDMHSGSVQERLKKLVASKQISEEVFNDHKNRRNTVLPFKFFISELNTGLSIAEISRKYGINESSLSIRLSYGLERGTIVKNNDTYIIDESKCFVREEKVIIELTDVELISLYNSGLSVSKIAEKFNKSKVIISRRLNSLRDSGEKVRDSSAPQTVISEDIYDVLSELYLEGFGVNFLSKKFNVDEKTIRRHLTRIGILDSSRALIKEGDHNYKRLKSSEFTEKTKRERFEEVNGICECCGKIIGSGTNYRLATYHHRKLVKYGGTREKENCMVLHRFCHEENFYELHGFHFDKLKEGYSK